MPELAIQLGEQVFEKLYAYAAHHHKTPQEIVIDSLEATLAEGADSIYQQERIQQFLRESGLFARLDQKLGIELETSLQPISQTEQEQLAQALSRGKSLSEIIIEDRGE